MPKTDPHRIFIPVMQAFLNQNTFTGSAGALRFRLEPILDEDEKEVTGIRSKIWYGEYCYEKSEIAEEQQFPLSEDGREALRNYLEALRDRAN